MIQRFVDAWDSRKGEIEAQFRNAMPTQYLDIVRAVVGILGAKESPEDYTYPPAPHPSRIQEIDWGSYQGTMLLILGGGGLNPEGYWLEFVDYGSCSGCDTLESIHMYDSGPPNEQQLKDLMSLALHIVQNIKEI